MPRLTVCPLSVVVFFGTAYWVVDRLRSSKERQVPTEGRGAGADPSPQPSLPPCRVVFVLGGPGAGKGTTCELLQSRLEGGGSWAHLSTGDLLRAERSRGGPLGDEINSYIASGQLVPSEVTCRLLEQGMARVYRDTGKTNFLIDGFPRSFSNATVWEETMVKHKVVFVLNLECPEEVLLGRLLHRGQTSGRADDTIEIIRKRFRTHQEEAEPILRHFEQLGKVHTVPSDQPVEDVYRQVAELFTGV